MSARADLSRGAGRPVGGLRRVVAVILVVLGAGSVLWVLAVGYGPRPDRTGSQLEFLDGSIADGAPERMQELFPEGSYFTYVLTGLAEARQGSATALGRARSRLAVIDSSDSTAIFGSGMLPDHGAFAAGWSLSLAVAVARASGSPDDLARVRTGAEEIASALGSSRSPFLASYPGQYWPCDTVVAVAGLAGAAELVADGSSWRNRVATWRGMALRYVDPATGLFPHRVDGDGVVLERPRGSSNSIIQAFWPWIAGAGGASADDDQWGRFVATFVTREAGLVGVREYPSGVASGLGDVDSGPLVLGVSASASAVTLAAARANGDLALAGDLDREADLLGLPLWLPGGWRYGLGFVPVGDAFLVWARTEPEGPSSGVAGVGAPRPWWLLFAVPGVLLVGLGLLLTRRRATVRA